MGSPCIETANHPPVFVCGKRHLRLVPIPEGLFHPDHPVHPCIYFFRLETTDADQMIAHLIFLKKKLAFIRKFLQLATATGFRNRTACIHTVPGRLNDLNESRKGIILFYPGHRGDDNIPRYRVFHKKREAVHLSYSRSFLCEVLDLQRNLFVLTKLLCLQRIHRFSFIC